MAFYFRPFPTTNFDLEKNGSVSVITDFTLRAKILNALRDKSVVYYNYIIPDGMRPDVVADKYYNDSTLEWLIFLVNDIVDPQFEWPMSSRVFDEYIKNKYGSAQAAQQGIHHYEWIIRPRQILNNLVYPEYAVEVTQTKYNTLSPSERRIVYDFDYEEDLNERRREIKILDERYVPDVLNLFEGVLNGTIA